MKYEERDEYYPPRLLASHPPQSLLSTPSSLLLKKSDPALACAPLNLPSSSAENHDSNSPTPHSQIGLRISSKLGGKIGEMMNLKDKNLSQEKQEKQEEKDKGTNHPGLLSRSEKRREKRKELEREERLRGPGVVEIRNVGRLGIYLVFRWLY